MPAFTVAGASAIVTFFTTPSSVALMTLSVSGTISVTRDPIARTFAVGSAVGGEPATGGLSSSLNVTVSTPVGAAMLPVHVDVHGRTSVVVCPVACEDTMTTTA